MNAKKTRRVDNVVWALTIISLVPYETGSPLAEILPPAAKPWVILAVLMAKLILNEMKARQASNKEDR